MITALLYFLKEVVTHHFSDVGCDHATEARHTGACAHAGVAQYSGVQLEGVDVYNRERTGWAQFPDQRQHQGYYVQVCRRCLIHDLNCHRGLTHVIDTLEQVFHKLLGSLVLDHLCVKNANLD